MADGTIPPEMQGKYLDIILFEVERLTKLTNNLLSLSEFENKGVPLEISTFDINKELKRCLATFEQRCTQKHISLDITFDAKTSLVDADNQNARFLMYHSIAPALQRITTSDVLYSYYSGLGKRYKSFLKKPPEND